MFGSHTEGPTRGDQSLTTGGGGATTATTTTSTDSQIIRVVSKNRPGYYWSVDEGIEGYLMQEAELFKVIRPGLYGDAGCISFESVTRPDHYIVHRSARVSLLRWRKNKVVFCDKCCHVRNFCQETICCTHVL